MRNNRSNFIILNISDFKIKVLFGPTEQNHIRNKMKNSIISRHRNFISLKTIKKVNFEIQIVDKKNIEIFSPDKTNKYYVHFYEESTKKNQLLTHYQISLYQFNFLLKIVLLKLLSKYKGFVLHASACRIDNKAHIFLGQSGAGKSTIVKLLKEKYPSLAEDSVIIRKVADNFVLYQTPITEKDDQILRKPDRQLIGNFYLLRKSKSFQIKRIYNRMKIINIFINQLFTEEKTSKIQIKYLLELISRNNNVYTLYFDKDKKKLIEFFSSLYRNT